MTLRGVHRDCTRECLSHPFPKEETGDPGIRGLQVGIGCRSQPLEHLLPPIRTVTQLLPAP